MMSAVKNVTLLAMNGFHEVIRHRLFYGMVVVALLVVGIGVILGTLSMHEEQRVAIDFGLLAAQLVLIATAVFFGSLSITRDIERKILMTLIARPLSRSQYILGKFLSIAIVLFFSLIFLGGILAALFYFFSAPINTIFLTALWGIYLEALVLLATSILFGTFSSSFLIVCYSASYFIIGHWIDTVREILSKSEDTVTRFFSDYVLFVFPNLEKFNWRPHVVYQDIVSSTEIVFYSFYAVAWIGLALVIGIYIFNRRDFV